jgi:hypothetical protein
MIKKILFVLLLAGTKFLAAQDCNMYIPFEEDKGLQYQIFNNRDKLQGTQDMIIKNVEKHSDYTEAVMHVTYLDNRDRVQHEGEFGITCRGNELIIDIQSFIDPALLEGFQGMEIQISSTDVIIPGDIKVGDVLPDAKLEMSVSSSGMKITDFTVNITDRKVEAMESITTPAGTFECFKITYQNEIDSRTMGISSKQSTRAVEYFSPGVGNVKSEQYDKRDRLDSYTVLSKIY